MKIKIAGKIFPPENEMRNGGSGLPVVLEGEAVINLTPKSLFEILYYGSIDLQQLCEFKIERDREGDFVNITLNNKEGLVTIKTRNGYLLPGSKKQVRKRIRKLIEQGWNLKLTREENDELQYPIDDLFPE